jgi:hypothetical protein
MLLLPTGQHVGGKTHRAGNNRSTQPMSTTNDQHGQRPPA